MLDKILKDAGIAVEFKMTRAMKDAFDATVFENVSLIKSIPEQYHRQIEGTVMRSVSAGRDLSILAKDLQARYGITKRRAAFIARSQNNLATATMTKVRQLDCGITEAIWLHSHGGREPRPTHVKNSGKKYNIETGWFDDDPKVRRYIWPGTLPNCRCTSRSVVKGFT
jgi:SPP1 gp7 family putative phage head morphogenesis protein